MIRFMDEREDGDDDIDFMDPFFQNAPVISRTVTKKMTTLPRWSRTLVRWKPIGPFPKNETSAR